MSTTIETLKNSNGAMLALAAIAFLITAVLVFFIIRMLIGGRLRMPGGRARQARLGIVDAFDLDRQRQLILVRRDNTEHLIMIGGPNDLLIESEIVRIEARDLRRDKAPEFAVSADGRIPAPFSMQAERSESDGQAADPAQLSLAIPPQSILPQSILPQPGPSQPIPPPRQDDPSSKEGVPVEPTRAPSFPLPPRRPPQPERRFPLRAPEPGRPAEPRLDGGLLPSDAPSRPIVEVPAEPRIDAPVAIDTAPFAAAPLPAPLVAPAPATPRTTPPSFLKPLPPRPPIRPLVRSNPRPPSIGAPEPTPPGPIPTPPLTASPPPMPPIAEIPPVEPTSPGPEPMVPHAEPAQTPLAEREDADSRKIDVMDKDPKNTDDKNTDGKDTEPKDALESLEEEMAKLLGRGPGV